MDAANPSERGLPAQLKPGPQLEKKQYQQKVFFQLTCTNIKRLVLCQPQPCSQSALTELCHVGVGPALAPDVQRLWLLRHWHLLTLRDAKQWSYHRSSRNDLFVLNIPHLPWKTWAAIRSVLADRPSINKHADKPKHTRTLQNSEYTITPVQSPLLFRHLTRIWHALETYCATCAQILVSPQMQPQTNCCYYKYGRKTANPKN